LYINNIIQNKTKQNETKKTKKKNKKKKKRKKKKKKKKNLKNTFYHKITFIEVLNTFILYLNKVEF